MRNKFILSLAILCFYVQASAQVGIGTISPNASSSLEIVSTTKGFLMPRMTAAQRTAIATPATGLLVFQTDPVAGFWYYTGAVWVRLNSTADALSIPSAYAANTSNSTLLVILGGTDIPLPSEQILSAGYAINGANTAITVANPGRYRIAYNLNTSAGLLVSTRLTLNGNPIPSSVCAPLISTSAFSKEIIVDVATANSTVSVQFYGLVGTAILNGAANLSIIRLN